MTSLRRQAFAFPLFLVAISLFILNFGVRIADGIWSRGLFSISLGLVILTFLLSYWHAKRLVKPLIDLVPQADGIAKGRLVVSNHGEDAVPQEVEYLARAIEQIGEKQTRDFAAMQKLERVRSEFLGNVSHELRTPIFAVQGFIETLLDGAIDDPSVNRDFLERAQIQAQRLNSLLNDLIDISRIESGEMRMSYRLFNLLPFLREVAREMQPVAEMKQIELRFESEWKDSQEIEVFGDKDRLKQVLVNLVDNAIKYSDNGKQVVVEAGFAAESEMIRVAVRDNGVGVAEEHIPRLFERFYRVDKNRARSNPGGTGLGLAIVKHIVEAHRGKITVVSKPGEGSTFAFTLHASPFG